MCKRVFALVLVICALSVEAREVELARSALVRDHPSSKAKKVGTASKGEKLKVLADELKNRWCSVECNGKPGWVWSEHLVASPPVSEAQPTIKIGSFNCLHLGWGSSKDVDLLANLIVNFDICALVEVMSDPPEGQLLLSLANATKAKTGKDVQWRLMKSDLVGRTSYKERYGFVYREDVVKVVEDGRFIDDDADIYDRDPYYATFKAGAFDFTLVAIHITFGKSKSSRKKEIEGLREVYAQIQESNGDEQDVLIMGDFNLPPDEEYWDVLKKTEPIAPSPLATTMRHLIAGTIKTSLSDKGYVSSYDNIWINDSYSGREFANKSDAIQFVQDLFPEEENAFKLAKQLVSDHVPVWGEFQIDKDDDD